MKKFFLISSFAFILLSGCKPDDVIPKDTTKPTITLTPLPEGAVRGNVSIKGAAADNTSIAKVEIYIDGTLVKTLTDGIIDFVWDTKTVKDGAHIIKVVAIDKEGNNIESTIDVTVMNALLEFTVPENSIANGNDLWIFLSDSQGKVWYTQNLKNNSTYSFNPGEDFTDETITLSIYSKPYKDVIIRTYSNLPFGKYGFKNVPATPSVPSFVGSAKLSITDRTDYSSIAPYLDNYLSYDLNAGPSGVDYVFKLPKADHNKVLLIDNKNPDVNKYLYLELAKNDDVKKSVASDFAAMTYQDVTVPKGSSTGDFYVRGYVDGVYLYSNNGPIDIKESNSFKIKYPPAVFDRVDFYVNINKDGETLGYFGSGNTYPAEMKTLASSITKATLTNNVVEYDATGTFDFALFEGYGNNPVSDVNTTWLTYLGDKVSNKVVIPALPSEISEAHPETTAFGNMFFIRVGLYDYDTFKNYNDYIISALKSESTFNFNEYLYFGKRVSAPGGRMSGSVSAPQPVFFDGREGIRPN